MAACQGALLLVDASQGVQAQSLSVFHTARERGLKIIPILNKVKFFLRCIESVSMCKVPDRRSGCPARQSQGTNALNIRY
jgi:translation elongation factor EF-4